MTSLRPDELQSQQSIEESRRNRERLKSGVKTVAGLGLSAAGAGLGSRILPFLNEMIPSDLAIKGISKISPKVGDFLRRGMDKGLDLKEGFNFLKENLTKEQKAKEPHDIISGYSPELSRFLKEHIQSGRSPKEAAAIAKSGTPHSKAVKQIEKETGENFVDFVERLFGGQPQQQQPAQQQQASQQPQQNQQTGQGQQALMAILQKANQLLGHSE